MLALSRGLRTLMGIYKLLHGEKKAGKQEQGITNQDFTKKIIMPFEPNTTLDNMQQTLIGGTHVYQIDVGH